MWPDADLEQPLFVLVSYPTNSHYFMKIWPYNFYEFLLIFTNFSPKIETKSL